MPPIGTKFSTQKVARNVAKNVAQAMPKTVEYFSVTAIVPTAYRDYRQIKSIDVASFSMITSQLEH